MFIVIKWFFCASWIPSETRFSRFCHDNAAAHGHVENHRHVKTVYRRKTNNKVRSRLVKKRHVEEYSLNCWCRKWMKTFYAIDEQIQLNLMLNVFFLFLAQFGEPECDGFLTTRWFIIAVHSHGEHCMFVSVSLFNYLLSWWAEMSRWYRSLWFKFPSRRSNLNMKSSSPPCRRISCRRCKQPLVQTS